MVYYRWFVQVPSFFLSRLRSLTGLIYFYCCDLIALVGHCQVKYCVNFSSISKQLSVPIAWFRLKFPHLTKGSVASSGVVHAILDFTAFDEQVYFSPPPRIYSSRKLINPFSPKVATSVGPACADVLRSITKQLEKDIIMGSQNTKTKTLALFNANNLTYEMFANINSTKLMQDQWGFLLLHW